MEICPQNVSKGREVFQWQKVLSTMLTYLYTLRTLFQLLVYPKEVFLDLYFSIHLKIIRQIVSHIPTACYILMIEKCKKVIRNDQDYVDLQSDLNSATTWFYINKMSIIRIND